MEKFVGSSFERMTYTDAIAALEKSGKKFEFPIHWGMDLQSEHERWLTEEHVKALLIRKDRFEQFMFSNDRIALRVYRTFVKTLSERLRQQNAKA